MFNLSNFLGKPIIYSDNQTTNDIKYRLYTDNSDAYPRDKLNVIIIKITDK